MPGIVEIWADGLEGSGDGSADPERIAVWSPRRLDSGKPVVT